MATKTVTLKDSNGDTLYPVTDSNVVNINQQKTLAQALDGVVYAEDPTQNATPTAWVTSDDIAWNTCNVIIDSSPSASTFFGGSYSKTFTVPKDGYYEISTPFSCIAHRSANAQSALYVAIDSSTKFTYSYMSTSGDTEWGTNRRTIGSASFIVALTAGQHTLSTSGNLYYDSSISGYTAIGSFYAKYFAPSS